MNIPYIIGEIGINHNGDIKLAKDLIDIAKTSGADAVKFQKRDINIVYSKEELDKPRESPWGTTQREQKEGLEFGREEYDEIDRYCKELNIDWFASAWDINSLEFLDKYNLQYNKVASAMITNMEFLEEVAKRKTKTLISTGMSTKNDIIKAIDVFIKYECPYVIMHCTSIYPCPEDKLNLSMITQLHKDFCCEIGYSGHSPGIIDSVIATVLGAKYIEKHITINRSIYGSDQSASLERRGLELTVKNCKLISTMLGNQSYEVYNDEINNSRKLRYWEK